MSDGEIRVDETLDAWRACGADRLDPVRFRFIEALQLRAQRLGGDARRILDERVVMLVAAYADDVARGDAKIGAAGGAASACAPAPMSAPAPAPALARGPLADLLDHVARHARDGRGGYPELDMLEYFRDTWSRVSADTQLRQSLDQVPKNAGPLNSNSLVHRSLSLMRTLSPEYLRQFLSYVDTLSWIERMAGDVVPTAGDAPRAKSVRKRARGNAR